MNLGKLRHRITLQSKAVVKDIEGITKETWTDLATVWAAIEPLRGREYFQAAAVNQENTVRFRIRYRPGITSSMRVKYRSRLFDIKSIIDIEERHVELHLMCQEVFENG